MGYRCWAERFVTADFSGSPVHYQKVTPTNSIALKSIRSRFVVYNTPAMTSLGLRIYSNANSAPGTLLYTSSTTWTKNQITTLAHGAREIYFEFSAPHLIGGNSYYLVPWITGYTGNESSHIGWVKAFPDPTYVTGLTIEARSVSVLPYSFGIIGATL